MGPSRRYARLTATLLIAAVVAMAGSPASANHVQNEQGKSVAFDHKAGNEWWVEATLSGASAGSVASVQARDDGGAWVALEKKSWGAYAASFHIEPGHKVQFRAAWSGGAVVASCTFTHPAGLEQCGSPQPGTFDATFTGFRGNEWWVQANVATNGPAISKVDVTTDNGATWKPLAKQSWGGWATSTHITQGKVVQMRATASDGQADLSSCRQWIPAESRDATIVSCPSGPIEEPMPFDATFTGVKGNDWWVQVNVAANRPVAGVNVRVGCATDWQALTKQSWGGWTASFNIPAGSKVDFQARTSTYSSDVSGGYIWPQATPTTGCPQGDWPSQGSYASYDLSSGVCGGGNCESSSAKLYLRYDAGRWLGTCYGRNTFSPVEGSPTTELFTTDNGGLPPITLPTNTRVGAQHRPDMFHTSFTHGQCERGWISSPVTVVRQEDLQTTLPDGGANPMVLRTWYAESTNESDNLYTTHWDTKIGLVLDLTSHPRRSGQGSESMVLFETNAPLG